MIVLRGVEYGTAAELAAALGPDITPDMIRRWAKRKGLRSHNLAGQGRGVTYFDHDQAAEIEAATRRGGRGRPRAA
jgi:hypothetical protein